MKFSVHVFQRGWPFDPAVVGGLANLVGTDYFEIFSTSLCKNQAICQKN